MSNRREEPNRPRKRQRLARNSAGADNQPGGSREAEHQQNGSQVADHQRNGPQVADHQQSGPQVADHQRNGPQVADHQQSDPQVADHQRNGPQVADHPQDGSQIVDYPQDSFQIVDHPQDSSQIVDHTQDGSQVVDHPQDGSQFVDHQQDVSQSADHQPDGSQDADHQQNGSQVAIHHETELGERLRKVMLCIVCMDLPHPDEIFQCQLGHILCEGCATRILAEAVIGHKLGQCPHCRMEISWKLLTKNLAVVQTVWELPTSCVNCAKQMEYKSLSRHLKMDCGRRVVDCQYNCLGCFWHGSQELSAEHEANCTFRNMSSDLILMSLRPIDKREQRDNLSLRQCFWQLCAYRIVFVDFELNWPRTLNMEHKFQSVVVKEFESIWKLRMKLVLCADSEQHLSYSLKLLSVPKEPMQVTYFLTLPSKGTPAKQLLDVKHRLVMKNFGHSGEMADFKLLPMGCPVAIYRLVAMEQKKLRLWMMMN